MCESYLLFNLLSKLNCGYDDQHDQLERAINNIITGSKYLQGYIRCLLIKEIKIKAYYRFEGRH